MRMEIEYRPAQPLQGAGLRVRQPGVRYLVGAILAGAVASAVAVALVSGAPGRGEGVPPEAVRVADRFVGELVVRHRSPDISLSVGVVQDDMYAWRTFLEREGIDTVVRGGEVQEGCEVPFPIFAPDRRMTGDCVVYEVRGRVTGRPRGPAVVTGRMRVWLIERHGAWRVAELDFTPRNGFRSTSRAFHVEGY
jgi:hypothetical protein